MRSAFSYSLYEDPLYSFISLPPCLSLLWLHTCLLPSHHPSCSLVLPSYLKRYTPLPSYNPLPSYSSFLFTSYISNYLHVYVSTVPFRLSLCNIILHVYSYTILNNLHLIFSYKFFQLMYRYARLLSSFQSSKESSFLQFPFY